MENPIFVEYYQSHQHCPVCGGVSVEQQLKGFLPQPDGTLIDRNCAVCGSCGWQGVVHDLLPAKGEAD